MILKLLWFNGWHGKVTMSKGFNVLMEKILSGVLNTMKKLWLES